MHIVSMCCDTHTSYVNQLFPMAPGTPTVPANGGRLGKQSYNRIATGNANQQPNMYAMCLVMKIELLAIDCLLQSVLNEHIEHSVHGIIYSFTGRSAADKWILHRRRPQPTDEKHLNVFGARAPKVRANDEALPWKIAEWFPMNTWLMAPFLYRAMFTNRCFSSGFDSRESKCELNFIIEWEHFDDFPPVSTNNFLLVGEAFMQWSRSCAKNFT